MESQRLKHEIFNLRYIHCNFKLIVSLILFCFAMPNSAVSEQLVTDSTKTLIIDKNNFRQQLYGLWLGQCIANWTGLVTEMDKIGGDGIHGQFYTRDDWGKADQASIWGQGIPSNLSETIDFVFEDEAGVWGSDDDTDIEFIYQYLLDKHKTTFLSAEQIRDGWLKHIYSDANTPYKNEQGEPENYLWVSNQQARDLMGQGMLPPATGDPKNNPHYDMIDAQLTTEIFGAYAPGRPDVALKMAYLPIRTTARGNAAWIAEFYVVMYSLAAANSNGKLSASDVLAMAEIASRQLPEGSYSKAMYNYVRSEYLKGTRWEAVRDQLYHKYQMNQEDGYDITSRNLYCNGCFAAGINFSASLVSLFYGEGDFKETVKIAALAGWDSDNPAATWGGMLGLIYGKDTLEKLFNRKFSEKYNIHRTRGGFANNGIYTFSALADTGISIIDRVVQEELRGDAQGAEWSIPREPLLGNDQ